MELDRSPTGRDRQPFAEKATTLDLRGFKCPLPVLHTRRQLARMPAGATLEVRCTDPLAALDIPNLVREMGDMLLQISADAGETRFRIRRAGRGDEPPGLAAEDPSASAGVDPAR